ncbi:hypothetical protein OG607_26390 [Streptomyces sp. NBC_01537]|uniref:hypothetical protein n=1 Tax=Streptomyces sp. NBC_01537 TaxID=2903896 RepID=UPI00386AB25F
MTAPKKRRNSRSKKRKTDDPGWELGPIPDDIFGAATDPPPKHSDEAPPLTITQRFRAVVGNPDIYAVAAAAFPEQTGPRVGCPPKFPPYVYLIFDSCISIFESARSAAAHLAEDLWWSILRDSVRTILGDEHADSLRENGPTRGNWNYFFKTRMKPELAALREASRDAWIAQALEQGLLDMEEGTWIRPACGQVIHGDATVAAPASRQTELESVDKRTGEKRRHKIDPDASYTVEGGGNRVYGNKYLSMAIRGANLPHSRVILDMETLRHKSKEADPDHEAEGVATVRMLKYIASKVKARIAYTHDIAIRGVHRAQLIAQGIVVFTPQAEGLEPQPLQVHTCESCDHELYAAGSRVCEKKLSVDGKKIIYNPLPVSAFLPRKGKTYRFYHQVEIPCGNGPTHTVNIRVDETSEDREIDPKTGRQRLNRTEHLRIVPPPTPAGRRLKGFRQDSEAQHSTWDLSYRHKCIPAYGADGGLAIYIGYAWLNNSVARIHGRAT